MSGRVLVTGASGFVGTALVAALTRAGKQVRAATRHPAAVAFPADVELVAVPDFGQPVDWSPILTGIDSVVHAASIAHARSKLDASIHDRVIHLATADLAEACVGAGIRRFIFLSSVRAQSGPAASTILTEGDAPRPKGPYGRAKFGAEAALRASALSWTILRPVAVYGPGAKGNLASLMRLADSPWPLPFASFSNRRSLLGVDNLIGAICFVLGAEATAREIYLVADPQPLTFAEIVAALRLGAGRAPGLFPVPAKLFQAGLSLVGRVDIWERLGGSLVVDPAKLMAAGWRPDPDTRAGLARMVQASLPHP